MRPGFPVFSTPKTKMSKIFATAGSNSSTSINFQLVKYTAGLLKDREVDLLELATREFPMYSEDREASSGIPEPVSALKDRIQASEGMVLSVNEHNGNPSAFFKNILDWLSREERRFLSDLPVLLMSTSGGKRGGASSLGVVEQMIPRFGGRVVATFSLPGYYDHFDPQSGISDAELSEAHRQALEAFLSAVDGPI